MTHLPALEGLIERCEAAQGPDRLLDAAIWCAFPPMPVAATVDEVWHGRVLFDNGGPDSRRSPAYTASIDAALALAERLLPEWSLRFWQLSPKTGGWCADLYHKKADAQFKSTRPTLPLAIILATLHSLTKLEG